MGQLTITSEQLQAPTPAQYIEWGMCPIPLVASSDPEKRKMPAHEKWSTTLYKARDWQPGQGIGLACGTQIDGSTLCVGDLDHKPEHGVDAVAEFDRILARLPERIRAQLFLARSTSGRGRYIAFRVVRDLKKSWIRDDRGRKIGDFLATGAQVVAPTPDRWLQGSLADIPLFWDDDDIDLLLAAFNYRAPLEITTATIDWNTIAARKPRVLIDERGLPHRFDGTSMGARVLLNDEPTRDTSQARYLVGLDLIRHGYTDEDAAAIMLELCDWEATRRKGRLWLRNDIARIISKVRALHPEASPALEQPELVPSTGGRPRSQTLDQFLYYLRQNLTGPDRVLKTQAEIAADLRCSKRTVQRLERQARDEKLMERYISSDGKHSYIELFDTHDNTAATTGEGGTIGGMGSVTSEIASLQDCAEGGVGGTAVSWVCWSCSGSASPDALGLLRCSVCGEVPVVARLVAEALDAYDGLRRSAKLAALVLGYVRSNGRPDASQRWVDRLLGELHDERQQRRADEKFMAKVRTLTDKQLTAKIKSLASKSGKAHDGDNKGQAWVFGRMAALAQREWDRREPIRKLMGRYDPVNLWEGAAS